MQAKELFVAAPGTGAYTRLCALQPLPKVSTHLELLGWQRHAVQPGLEPHRKFLCHFLACLAIEGFSLATRQRDTRHPAAVLAFVDGSFMIRAAFRHDLCSSCVVCVLPSLVPCFCHIVFVHVQLRLA